MVVTFVINLVNAKSAKVFAPPKLHSVPRAAHEARGDGYSQQGTKFSQLPPWQYHAYYWMLAFLYEDLLKIYETNFPEKAPPQRNKFASKNAMNVANSDWATNVRSGFSTNFQKVIQPVQLAQNLAHYLRSKAPPNHKNCWGFSGLMWHHVGDISTVCACTVHTFATFLSDLPIFQQSQQVWTWGKIPIQVCNKVIWTRLWIYYFECFLGCYLLITSGQAFNVKRWTNRLFSTLSKVLEATCWWHLGTANTLSRLCFQVKLQTCTLVFYHAAKKGNEKKQKEEKGPNNKKSNCYK